MNFNEYESSNSVLDTSINRGVFTSGNVSRASGLEGYVDDYTHKYDDLKKEIDNLIKNDYSTLGAFFKPFAAAQYRHNLRLKQNQLSELWNMVETAKLKLAESKTNQQLFGDKYVTELAALKKAGITNPYFMLRNGVINGPNYAANVNTSAHSQPVKDYSVNSFKDLKNFIFRILGSFSMGSLIRLLINNSNESE